MPNARGTWAAVRSFWRQLLGTVSGVSSYLMWNSFHLSSTLCENQEGFWEAQPFSIFAARQLSSWLSSWEARQFRAKQPHKMTGRRRGCSRKSICKPSLGRLLLTVLYKVNGNQGATIPETSSPLILNNEIKMGSLYPGAALASRPLGNKAPYRLSLDLKAQLETFICTEHLARRCEKGLFSPPPWLYFSL